MSLIEAASTFMGAALEAASLVWMEIAMFLVAATIYAVLVGSSPRTKPRGKAADGKASFGSLGKTTEAPEPRHGGDHRAVLRAWQSAVGSGKVPDVELSKVVDAMRKLGHTAAAISTELRRAVESTGEGMLPALATLPGPLLRDDAAELLDGTLKLLEEHGRTADPAIYAGLMGSQLRRRDHAGAAATAARLPEEALTPKIRAMLATAAVQRGRLDEALGNLRQVPPPEEGQRCPVPSGAAMQLLGLALREGRVTAAAQELKRVQARLEARHLDDLLSDCRRRGSGAVREVLEAGTLLQAPKGPGAFHALAGVLAQDRNAGGLAAVVDELEAEAGRGPRGLPVGEPLALALLDACKALKDADLATRVSRLHRAACAGAPGARVLSAACGALAVSGRAVEACDFYEAEMAPRGLWPEGAAAASLAKAASEAGRGELAARLSEHQGPAPRASDRGLGALGAGGSDAQKQALLIRTHARERDLPAAEAVFRRLQASGSPSSPLFYNCFLDACVQCGDMDSAAKHFEEMKRLNLVDVVGFNTMLKAHLARGCSEEARALLAEMSARGLQANKVTFNELLHAKVLEQDRRGVWQVLDEMTQAGVKANSVTCSILLKSLTPRSGLEDVRRIMALIEEVEEQIDEVLFSSVIEACIRIKQLDILSDMMRRYRAKGGFLNLTAPTYGSMIKAYGQAGQPRRVHELWAEMEERGVKPTSITLGCMAEALVANGEAEEAWRLLHEQLASEERRGCVNTVIYSTVLKGFAVSRRIDKVFAVYQEMRSNEIPCNTITYNTMLDACAKCCAMDRASKLLEDMKESCIEPDIITYSTIVKGYCLQGDVDRAFKVLEDMKSDGKFSPDEIMYNSILDGCAKQHRVDEALRVLEEMRSSGIGPSNYTLSILVKLLGHARRLGQAFRMVEDLSNQNGFRPNIQVYTCLVQACVLNKRLERALALHDTMVADAGCVADEKFYAVLARGCLQSHQPSKAVDVVRAAYRLEGHGLATPSRRDRAPAGIEARALEEVAWRLREGGREDWAALEKLQADLLEHRGVRIGDGSGGKSGGKGGKEAGKGKGRRFDAALKGGKSAGRGW